MFFLLSPLRVSISDFEATSQGSLHKGKIPIVIFICILYEEN